MTRHAKQILKYMLLLGLLLLLVWMLLPPSVEAQESPVVSGTLATQLVPGRKDSTVWRCRYGFVPTRPWKSARPHYALPITRKPWCCLCSRTAIGC